MRQLGKAIGILIRQELDEDDMYEDARIFNAPSECYADIERGFKQARRLARRRACHAAGVNSMRHIRRLARKAMGNDAPIYRRYGSVPY